MVISVRPPPPPSDHNQGSPPGPRWGTSVPRPPFCPPPKQISGYAPDRPHGVGTYGGVSGRRHPDSWTNELTKPLPSRRTGLCIIVPWRYVPFVLFTHPRRQVARMRICFTYVFFGFLFVFFLLFSVRHKNTRQPFSGTAERIFMKLLPNDSGENVVCIAVPKWGLAP